VASANIVNGSIVSADIADGTIATVDIANAAVTAAKLADDSVTLAKIADCSSNGQIVKYDGAAWQCGTDVGITSLNGLTSTSQTFVTASTGTDFTISSTGSTHTFSIPDAGPTARGLVTTGAQTFAGTKTFSSAPVFSTLTQGSVFFAGPGGLLSQSNATLYWNSTTGRLGVGTNSPNNRVEITHGTGGNSGLRLTNLTSAGTLGTNANGDVIEGAAAVYGDVKTGVQSTDHNGWIRLDGRAKSSLTATQQARATSLGFGTNIPDATDATLSQNGDGALGSVSGSNTKTIAQNQLPNVTLGGSTSGNSAGTPSGSISSDSAGTPSGSISSVSAGTPSGWLSNNGNHYHHVATANNDVNNSGSQGWPQGGHNSVRTTDRRDLWAPRTDMTNTTGDHSHTFYGNALPGHSHTFAGSALAGHSHTFTGSAMGNHSHSITTNSINGGVAQQSLDVTSREMHVNVFMYLGA
jgi:hypothetical protein